MSKKTWNLGWKENDMECVGEDKGCGKDEINGGLPRVWFSPLEKEAIEFFLLKRKVLSSSPISVP